MREVISLSDGEPSQDQTIKSSWDGNTAESKYDMSQPFPPKVAALDKREITKEISWREAWRGRLLRSAPSMQTKDAGCVIACSPLHDAICKYVQKRGAEADDVRVKKALELIKRLAINKVGLCGVVPFGSRACGTATENSDLDVCITGLVETKSGGGGFDKYQKREAIRLLRGVQKGLIQTQRAGVREVQKVTLIQHARVPILKCVLYNLPVDISVGSTNGVAAVPFIRALVSSFPPLKPLLLVFKCFLASRVSLVLCASSPEERC